jgi:hypothetical protein
LVRPALASALNISSACASRATDANDAASPAAARRLNSLAAELLSSIAALKSALTFI